MNSLVDTLITPYFSHLRQLLGKKMKGQTLYKAIVDAPFTDKMSAAKLDLGIVVLLLVNKKTHQIDRVALSNTELAKKAVSMSAKPFKAIKIPLDYEGNMIAKAIRTNSCQKVSDWQYLFIPALTPQEARLNQAGAGIECSVVYPLSSKATQGALIFSFFQPPENISPDHLAFAEAYTKLANDALTTD